MSEDARDPMASWAARSAEKAAADREAHAQRLLGEYGPDRWGRGTVLIFRPGLGERDQETRAAVKIGPGLWTLTARGRTRTWAETLALVGLGRVLMQVSNETEARFLPGRLEGTREAGE